MQGEWPAAGVSSVRRRRGVPWVWWGLAAVLTTVSALTKLPCLRGGADTDRLATTQCYSDIPLFYVGRGLAADFGWFGHLLPGYRDLEYPPVVNLFIEASAHLTHLVRGIPQSELRDRRMLTEAGTYDLPGMAAEERTFFLLSCAGLLVAVLVALAAAWRAGWTVGDRRSWVAVAPLVVLTVTLNWDVVALAFAVLALVAWQRRQPALLGTWVALGTAAKLFPLVLLAAAVILLARPGSRRALAPVLTSFVVVTALANAPLLLSDRDAWSEFWTSNADRPSYFGSAWLALRMVGHPVGAETLSLVLAAGMLLTWLALAALTWTRRIEPTLAELSLVFLLVFFALGKVYSPQYSLWVVLGLLVVTRSHRLVLLVAAAETWHYVATWLYIRGMTTPEQGIDRTYWSSIALRLAAEGLVVVLVLLRARRRTAEARDASPAPEPPTATDPVSRAR